MKLSSWQIGHLETAAKRLFHGEAVRVIGLDEAWHPVVSRDYMDDGRKLNVWYAIDPGGGRTRVSGIVRELFDGDPLFESIQPKQARDVMRPLLQPNKEEVHG